MAKKMLQCPHCQSDLRLNIGYTGADWETVAGEGSGYGDEISLRCTNDKCASIFTIVHAKSRDSVSIVKEEYRHFRS